MREHNEALNRIDFIESRDEITTQYDPGTLTTVQQHDGSILRLRKLGEEYDPSDKVAAMKRVQEGLASGEVVTGLLYVDPTPKDLHHHLNTVEAPLNTLEHARPLPRPVGARPHQRQPALSYAGRYLRITSCRRSSGSAWMVRPSRPDMVSAMHIALRIASSVASAAARKRLVIASGAIIFTLVILSFWPM